MPFTALQIILEIWDETFIQCESILNFPVQLYLVLNVLCSDQIRVNSVNPTVVMTEMGRQGWSNPEKVKTMMSRIPLGRFAGQRLQASYTYYWLHHHVGDNSWFCHKAKCCVGSGYMAQIHNHYLKPMEPFPVYIRWKVTPPQTKSPVNVVSACTSWRNSTKFWKIWSCAFIPRARWEDCHQSKNIHFRNLLMCWFQNKG